MFMFRFLLCGMHKPAPLVQFRAAAQTREARLSLRVNMPGPGQRLGSCAKQESPPWAQLSPRCQTHLHVCSCAPAFNCFMVLLFISSHWLKSLASPNDHHQIFVTSYLKCIRKSAICLLFSFPAHSRLI